MVKKFILAAAAMIAFAASASAGVPGTGPGGAPERVTVSGYITDRASGETLIGAGVVCAAPTAGGAVTNNYGFYTLTLPRGGVDLVYSYVGCSPEYVHIDLVRDTTVNMALSQAETLEAATVVSRKDAGIGSTYMGLWRYLRR